jgi:hypothetical protein
MFRPGHDELCKPVIGPRLEPLQPTLLDQFIAELTESKSGFLIAKVRSSYLAEEHISDG